MEFQGSFTLLYSSPEVASAFTLSHALVSFVNIMKQNGFVWGGFSVYFYSILVLQN